MRKDLTEIILVVDRSGSMDSCKIEAQNGINKFIEDQKNKAGSANFTLLQFDNEIEYVFKSIHLNDVNIKYILNPRGMTALLDAVGKAINDTGERLNGMKEEDKPGLVVFGIITDGQENASNLFKRSQIKEMITHQNTKYNWQFTFLGANQDAFAEAGSIGIAMNASANYNVYKSHVAYSNLSANVGRMRSNVSAGLKVENEYTDEERNSQI